MCFDEQIPDWQEGEHENGLFCIFSNYSIGLDAYQQVPEVCQAVGTRILLIGGKKALAAAKGAAYKAGLPVFYISYYSSHLCSYADIPVDFLSDGAVSEAVRCGRGVCRSAAALVGFTDMFIPALLITEVRSVKTKFIIGVLSLIQIIYLTEVGTIIIKSEILLNLWKLFLIFMERTLIAIPLIVLFAKLFI